MRNENKKQKQRENVKQNKKGTVSGKDNLPQGTDDASMSSGNLVNNPRGRSKTQDLHTKNSVTGSDNDGQVD